jgi:hypothetical protein
VWTRFSACPDRPWGPPSLLVKWVPGLSQGVKCSWGVLLTTHPLLVPQSWKSRVIPLPTTGPHRACNWITLPLQDMMPHRTVNLTFTISKNSVTPIYLFQARFIQVPQEVFAALLCLFLLKTGYSLTLILLTWSIR